MSSIIHANGLTKSYGKFDALKNVSFDIGAGQIVGLIGPNGAGKTTALRCLLGLSTYKGQLSVLGKDPQTQRTQLLNEVAFIADTAVLPKWITTAQILEYMQGVHPNFDRAKAEGFLSATEVGLNQRVSQMSKGMITQLHLAVAISIDAKLLVLDEPTLGLDILYRKRFYHQLLEDFFDERRTIVITTHQVEEIEHLLTHLMFIKKGEVVLNDAMESLANRFVQIDVSSDQLQAARALQPISEQAQLGGSRLLFEGKSAEQLAEFGQVANASVADLYVAIMGDGGA